VKILRAYRTELDPTCKQVELLLQHAGVLDIHTISVKESFSLGERIYCCEVCGFQEDRDINAAMNLRNLAVSSTVDKACCPESAGSSRKM
jgi:transposase